MHITHLKIMSNFTHIPVLLNEAIEALEVKIGQKYIDATLGGGGHTREIIKLGGLVLGIDQDDEALEFVSISQKPEISSQKLKLIKGNFRDIKKLAIENKFEKIEGILFDLGVSSHQLDTNNRGFSIKGDSRLDMRMDKSQSLSAYEVVNDYPRDKLAEIFYKYGEEHNAKIAAQAINDTRRKKEIVTTGELAAILMGLSHKSEPIHPATRVFQAIRIEVNDELEALKKGLIDSLGLLSPGGKLVVISFHSLEDRIVKQTFAKFERDGVGSNVYKKPVTANNIEIKQNKRSRSAKMRVFKKYE